jgi:hypothetical protein
MKKNLKIVIRGIGKPCPQCWVEYIIKERERFFVHSEGWVKGWEKLVNKTFT